MNPKEVLFYLFTGKESILCISGKWITSSSTMGQQTAEICG